MKSVFQSRFPRVFGALIVIALFHSLPSFGAWNENAREAFKNYTSLFEDPSSATVWGGLQWGIRRSGKTEVIERSTQVAGYAKPFRYLVALQKSKKKVIPAPLVIFLPGMFTDVESSRAKRFIEVFANRGYHVLLPPNPWSPHAIESIPENLPGYVTEEANTAWNVSANALAELRTLYGSEVFTSVSLAGESYGTILASIFLDIDHAKEVPLIDGSATLFSPILEMLPTLEAVDSLMDRSEARYAAWTGWDLLRITLDFIRSKTQSELGPDRVVAGEAMLAYQGFSVNLLDTAYAIEKYLHLGNVPKFSSKEEKTKWELGFRFVAGYFDKYTPGLRERYSGKLGSMRHWLGRSGWLRNGRLRVLMSADDVVNSNGPNDPREIFSDADLILLPHGGHSGFLAYPWFDEFADRAFLSGVEPTE